MKSLVIIDTSSDGHHREYLAEFGAVALETKRRVFYLTPAKVEKPNTFTFCQLLAKLPANIWKRREIAQQNLLTIANAVRELETKFYIDRAQCGVLLAYADDFLDYGYTARDWDGIVALPFCGILFNPTRFRMKYGGMRWWIRTIHPPLTAGRCFRRLGILNEHLIKPLSQCLGKGKVDLLPDVSLRSYATSSPSAFGNPLRVVVIGSIERRKGIIEFINIAKIINRSRKGSMRFQIFGKIAWNSFNERERAMIRSAAESDDVEVFDKWLTDNEFDIAVESADIIWVAYSQFAESSNLVAVAVQKGKPVIGRQGTVIGDRVKAFNLGIVIAGAANDAVAELLRFARSWATTLPDFAKGAQEFGNVYTLTRFREKTYDLLQDLP